ncbi:MAG: bilirubin oxidase, partial [Acidobacteriota bacterium]|nr:bilirubin oxidase [Acidobacteriota bacterium]
MASRRLFIKQLSGGAFGLFVWTRFGGAKLLAQIPGGTLHPADVNKYQTPMLIPPAMPRAGKVRQRMAKNIDYYEIAMRQFS